MPRPSLTAVVPRRKPIAQRIASLDPAKPMPHALDYFGVTFALTRF
jgi:hypothetical protein